jgi:hydrogenase nickel incorporation protein HypA/HybF
MHELSIASALFEQVKSHTPSGTVVRSVKLRIGPMQGIEPDSLRFGWEAVCQEQGVKTPQLDLECLLWRLTCPDCSRRWESPELYVACACGCATPVPEGGSELQLLSIDVEECSTEEVPTR